MAGLIEKDIRLLWCNKLSAIVFVVFAAMFGALVKGAFILGYLPFAMCLLMMNTIAYDEMDKGYQFLLTFPIDRKMYVREKYVLTLGIGVFSWVVAMVIYFVTKMIQGERLDMSIELPVTLIFLPVIVLFILYMLPLQMKFGVEKTRIVVAGTCGVSGACILGFTKFIGLDTINDWMESLCQMSGWVLLGIAVAVVVLLIAVSYHISIGIMKRKEF